VFIGTFIVIIINLWQSCDFLESSMISSNFETDILEIFFVSNSDIFVVNWIVSFKATAGIEPTVSVSFLVVLELDESAYGSHSFVSEASIHVLDIDSTTATGISFFSLLFPNVETNTVCWIIWLPL
jgi:3-methyladenine DNA glycosylase AlkD